MGGIVKAKLHFYEKKYVFSTRQEMINDDLYKTHTLSKIITSNFLFLNQI